MEFTWALKKGDKTRIGITPFAVKELGEIVYIQLPKVGDVLKQGQDAVILESTKAATDITSPLPGRVTAINYPLLETPSLINGDPEGAGWLFEISSIT